MIFTGICFECREEGDWSTICPKCFAKSLIELGADDNTSEELIIIDGIKKFGAKDKKGIIKYAIEQGLTNERAKKAYDAWFTLPL